MSLKIYFKQVKNASYRLQFHFAKYSKSLEFSKKQPFLREIKSKMSRLNLVSQKVFC